MLPPYTEADRVCGEICARGGDTANFRRFVWHPPEDASHASKLPNSAANSDVTVRHPPLFFFTCRQSPKLPPGARPVVEQVRGYPFLLTTSDFITPLRRELSISDLSQRESYQPSATAPAAEPCWKA